MMDKYTKKVSALALTPLRKSLCIEISRAVIFHGRELNLVLKCRHIKTLSCGKKKNKWGLVWKKMRPHPLLDPCPSLFTLTCKAFAPLGLAPFAKFYGFSPAT